MTTHTPTPPHANAQEPAPRYRLWKLLHDEHKILALESELDEIIDKAKACHEWQPDAPAPSAAGPTPQSDGTATGKQTPAPLPACPATGGDVAGVVERLKDRLKLKESPSVQVSSDRSIVSTALGEWENWDVKRNQALSSHAGRGSREGGT